MERNGRDVTVFMGQALEIRTWEIKSELNGVEIVMSGNEQFNEQIMRQYFSSENGHAVKELKDFAEHLVTIAYRMEQEYMANVAKKEAAEKRLKTEPKE